MIPRYSRPEMAAIWEPENRFRIWLDIETHATAYAARGLVGWSWLFAKHVYIATSAGLAVGRYAGRETTAMWSVDIGGMGNEARTGSFARWQTSREAFWPCWAGVRTAPDTAVGQSVWAWAVAATSTSPRVIPSRFILISS